MKTCDVAPGFRFEARQRHMTQRVVRACLEDNQVRLLTQNRIDTEVKIIRILATDAVIEHRDRYTWQRLLELDFEAAGIGCGARRSASPPSGRGPKGGDPEGTAMRQHRCHVRQRCWRQKGSRAGTERRGGTQQAK